ncbi:atrial natriuretic peptide receptor 2-like [Heteronotia binoei]|uniref:atrial natriuretic peptide receptor 2-like n=1 Tax=Heteronotia binoei TaxID=13085 RepID=UPI00292EB471|nr:atrial natriuretic peptide receptor 2-like [Heteronotia binoei]
MAPRRPLLLGVLLVTLLRVPSSVAAKASAAPTVEVTVGVLLPGRNLGYPWAWPRVKPALSLALEALEPQLPPLGLDVRIAFDSTEDENGNCSPQAALSRATGLKLSHDPDVLLGLGCQATSSAVASLAQRWQLPLLTAGLYQGQGKFGNSTAVYGGPLGPALGAFLAQLHRRFNWTSRAALVVSFSRYREYFQELLPDSAGFTVRVHQYEQPDQAVRFIRAEGRAIYICGPLKMLQEIMSLVHAQGMANGDYVFLFVDVFEESLRISGYHEAIKPWQIKQSQDAGGLREAFQTVLVVTPHEPQTPEYRRFQSQLTLRAKREFAVPENKSCGTVVPGCFHDVLLLYLRALNETLQEGGTKRDTSHILEKMRGLEIRGVTGTVSINSNNDREMDFDLWAMRDVESGEYQVVAHYIVSEKWINWTGRIHWKKGGPPLDNPPWDAKAAGKGEGNENGSTATCACFSIPTSELLLGGFRVSDFLALARRTHLSPEQDVEQIQMCK